MKTSKFFVSTLIAAAAMTATAWATDYTVTDNSSDLIDAVSGDTVTIDFSENASSYLYASEDAKYTINADVVIEDATIHNGYSNKTYIFNGSVKGSGEFYYQADKGSNNQTYIFNGDVSGYSGNMTIASGKNGTFTFTNKTGTGAITATNASSVLNLNGATVNNSAIDVSTINISGSTSFAAESTTLTGNVIVAADSEVSVSGALTISSAISNSGTITFGEGASLALTGLTASLITGLDENTTSLQTVGSTYTIATGGTVSGLTTANVTVNGAGVTSLATDCKSATISESVYNIATEALVAYSDISSGDLSAADRINVAGTLDMGTASSEGASNPATLSAGNITGTGTIKWGNIGEKHYVTLALNDGFTGTLQLSGRLRVDTWGDLKNVGTVNLDGAWLYTISAATINNAVVITDTVRTETGGGDGSNLYITGDNNNNSVLTFSDSFDASEKTVTVASGTTTFAGATTIGTLKISGGNVVYSISALDNSGFENDSTVSVDGGVLFFGENAKTITKESCGDNMSVVVQSGANVTLAIAQNTTKEFSGNITLKDGATYYKYDGGVNLTGNVTLGESDTDTVYLLGNWGKVGTKISGVLSGAGTAYFANNGNSNTETEILTISGSNNTYSGELVVGKKNAETNSGRNTELVLASETALANGKVNLAGSAENNYAQLSLGASAVTVSGLSGTQYGKVALGSDIEFSTLTVNGGGAFEGVIVGAINLVKSGEGVLTLSGENTYSGGTTISAGTLVVGANSALGDESGAVTISGGQLSVSENVTLSQTAITIVLSDAYNTENSEKIAAISGAGALADGTTIALDKAADAVALSLVAEAPQKYSYQIFDSESSFAATAWSFELDSAWDGWEQSYDTSTGILTLTIPEPSAFGLLAGVGALALCVSRRRRNRR